MGSPSSRSASTSATTATTASRCTRRRTASTWPPTATGGGSGANQFEGPMGIAIAEDGTMCISDCNNGRIQVLSSDGDFIKTFCEVGSGDGQLKRPCGVELVGDLLLVADGGNHRVATLDRKDGRQLATVGSNGDGNGQFVGAGMAAFDSTLAWSSPPTMHKLSFFECSSAVGVGDLPQDLAELERACRSQGSPVLFGALLHHFTLHGGKRQLALGAQVEALLAKIAEAKQKADECKTEHTQIGGKIEPLKAVHVDKRREAPLRDWSAEGVALWVRTVEGGVFHEHTPEFAKRDVTGLMLAEIKRKMFNFVICSSKEHQAALWALLLELRQSCEPHAQKRRRVGDAVVKMEPPGAK